MEPIPLRIIPRPDMRGLPGVIVHAHPEYGWETEPGDMWREPSRDEAGREAWGIVLPNHRVWYTTDQAGAAGMWDVHGDPPAITAHPSINDTGERPWHGWIRGGRIETIS